MPFFPINKKKLIVSVAIASVSLIGDKNSENQSNDLAAALCDNVTHGLIGALTWLGMYVAKTSNTDFYFIFEIILCGIFSSIIDADHFIAAKSFHLKDATNLKNRPFMHSTTLVFIIVFTILSISHILKVNWLCKFGWILAAAFLSHHIRDSKRRGFWFWPVGSTPPTPTFVYVSAQMILPHVLAAIAPVFPSSKSFKTVSQMSPSLENV